MVKRGAKRGTRHKGYWFRKGRCWVVTVHGKPVPLYDDDGRTIKDQRDEDAAKRAYARYLLKEEKRKAGTLFSVEQVCMQYLESIKDKEETYLRRCRCLWDFCHGAKKTEPDQRLHPGYGKLPAADLTPKDVHDWVAAHEGWKSPSTKAVNMQAISRAMHWGVEQGMLTECPIRNLKVPQSKRRLTYFTPKEEKALLEHAHPNMRDALFASIYSGARPGEVAQLTSEMVEETKHGQVWRIKNHKTRHRTNKDRRVFVPVEVAELVRARIARQGRGIVFPTPRDRQWSRSGMAKGLQRLRKRVAKEGIKIHQGACWYTCRHTFAKRMLTGRMPWQDGHGCTIEQLCKLMGNTRKIAWAHYGDWEEDSLMWASLMPGATDPTK